MYLHDLTTAPAQDAAKARTRLDPRARLLCAAGCAVGASLAASLPAGLLWCTLGFAALATAMVRGLPWQRVRAGLFSVNAFMLAVWCTLPLTLPWTEALPMAALLTLKANAALFFLLALCAALSLPQAASALHALGLPPTLVTLFMLTCRHLHDLRQDFAVSLQALHLRVPAPSWRRALYLYACLVCSVLVRASDKANSLRMALAFRHGGDSSSLVRAMPASLHGRLHWTWKETGLCALSLFFCALTVWNPSGDSLAQALTRF